MKLLACFVPLAIGIAAACVFFTNDASTSEPDPSTMRVESKSAEPPLPTWTSDDPHRHCREALADVEQRLAQMESLHRAELAAREDQIDELSEQLAEAAATAKTLRERLHEGARHYAQHGTKLHDWAGASVYADVVANVPDLTDAQTEDVLAFLEKNASRFREVTAVQRQRKSAAEGGMTSIDVETGAVRRIYPDEIPDNSLEFLTAKDEYFAFFESVLDPHQFTVFERSPDRFDWSLVPD